MGTIAEQKPDPATAKQTYEKGARALSGFQPPRRKRLAILYAAKSGWTIRRPFDLAIKGPVRLSPDDAELAKAFWHHRLPGAMIFTRAAVCSVKVQRRKPR